MKFIDAGFFISAFIADEAHHAAAASALQLLEKGNEEIVYSDYVLDEVLTWIRSRKGNRASVLVLDVLLGSNLKLIHLQDSHILAATELFRKYEGLSFTDCTTIAYMWDTGIQEIYSFDSDFDGIPHIVRLDS